MWLHSKWFKFVTSRRSDCLLHEVSKLPVQVVVILHRNYQFANKLPVNSGVVLQQLSPRRVWKDSHDIFPRTTCFLKPDVSIEEIFSFPSPISQEHRSSSRRQSSSTVRLSSFLPEIIFPSRLWSSYISSPFRFVI